MQKVFEGAIVHVRESQFEGSNGEIIEGKNVELVSGDLGYRIWVPRQIADWNKALENADVKITCNVRVKDGGRLSYVATDIDVRS